MFGKFNIVFGGSIFSCKYVVNCYLLLCIIIGCFINRIKVYENCGNINRSNIIFSVRVIFLNN